MAGKLKDTVRNSCARSFAPACVLICTGPHALQLYPQPADHAHVHISRVAYARFLLPDPLHDLLVSAARSCRFVAKT